MMNVSSMGSGSVSGSTGAGAVGRAEARGVSPGAEQASSSPARRGEDRVELSDAARLLAKLQGLPEIRQELVDRVRAEIEAGTYETPELIDQTIEAMLGEIEQEL
jgi:negative regulator of flagellin synthesis FlgM